MVFNQFKRLFCVFLGFGVTTVKETGGADEEEGGGVHQRVW